MKLAPLLLRGVAEPTRLELSRGDLELRLVEIVERARACWPGVRVADEVFMEAIARRVGDDDLGKLHLNDIYLVAACAAGDATAISFLDDSFIQPLAAALSRVDASPDLITEAQQIVRIRLLFGEEPRPPQIDTFSGRGSLRSWIRVIAMRELSRLQQPHARVEQESMLVAEATLSADPELVHMRHEYRHQLTTALETAVNSLGARHRNVLKHHYVDNLTLEQIAALYRVHRATAARWLGEARTRLLKKGRAAFERQVDLGESGLSGALRLLESGLHVSLRRILHSASVKPAPARR